MPIPPILGKLAAAVVPAAIDQIAARLSQRAERIREENDAPGKDYYQSDPGRRPTYRATRADEEDSTEIVVYADEEGDDDPMRRIISRRQGRATPAPRSGRELERSYREPPSWREQERPLKPRSRRGRKWLAILLTLCLLGGSLFYVAPRLVPWWPSFLNPFGVEFPIKKQVQESTTVFKLKMENINGTDIAKDNFKIDKHRVSFTGTKWWKLSLVFPGSVKEFHISGNMIVRYNIDFKAATSEVVTKGKTVYVNVLLPTPAIGDVDVGSLNIDEGGLNFLNLFGEDTPQFKDLKPQLQDEARKGTDLNSDFTLRFVGDGALTKIKEITDLILPGMGYTVNLNVSIKGTDGHIVQVTTPVAPVGPAPSPSSPPAQTPSAAPTPTFKFA